MAISSCLFATSKSGFAYSDSVLYCLVIVPLQYLTFT